MSDNNTHKTSGAGSTGSVQDVIYITDDDDDQYQGAPGPVQAGQGAAGSAGESSSGSVQAGQGAAGSAGESSSEPVQAGSASQGAVEASEELEPCEFEIYSGTSNFPHVLQAAADELIKDVNDWGKDLLKKLIELNKRRARFRKGSLIDGCCWEFNASKWEILQVYTGELRFEGAEPADGYQKGTKNRMKEQGILTQAQFEDSRSDESCYSFSLPYMARLIADDGNLYDVRLSVCGDHKHKSSETPKGRGRLIGCGALINHSCRDQNCRFAVIDLETLCKHEKELGEKLGHDDQDAIVTESIHIQDQGTPGTPTDSEKDEDGASVKSDDTDPGDEGNFNLFEVLERNKLCPYFLEYDVDDLRGNYLPSMIVLIMANRDFHEEATINYGFTTESRDRAQSSAYEKNAFWMPANKVKKLFIQKCEQDADFAKENEIILCQCFKKECEENIELDDTTEEFDDETNKEARKQKVDKITQRYDCPADVARIAKKETEEEKNDRIRNEAYLLAYTAHNDRKNAELDRRTVEFLIETDKDQTREGPLLGHWGFPLQHKETLDSAVDEVNDNVKSIMELIKQAQGFHGVGRHYTRYGDTRNPFNGDKAIPDGLMLTATVGVLMPKQMIPKECIPHAFNIGWILGYDSAIMLLGCDHGYGTLTGKHSWVSAAAFPHSCIPNIRILDEEAMRETLSDFYERNILECLNKPIEALDGKPTTSFFRVGIAIGKIPEHAALSISKIEFSRQTNPIYTASKIRYMHEKGQIPDGNQVCRCLCSFPGTCPGNNYELICECLNREIARSRHIIRKDALEATVKSQQRKLNISKEGFNISEPEMSGEEMQLKSRLGFLLDNNLPTYNAGEKSVYSPDHLSHKANPVDTSKIISRREIVRHEYVFPPSNSSVLNSSVLKDARTKKRVIVPTVQESKSQDESKAYLEDTGAPVASAPSGEGGSASDPTNLSTPNAKKHDRGEEVSPPEAPGRKISAAPRSGTPPPCPATMTEDFVDLVTSEEDSDPDGAGPAAAASAAQCYDTESDSDIEKPDEDSALPTASVPTNDSRPVPSTGVKSRAKRASSGKTKKTLVDEHVAKAVDIEKANSVDFDKFRVVFARVNAEKLAVDAEMGAIVAVSGHEAERRRTFLRVRIQELSESLTTLNGLKEQFEQKHLNVSAYRRSKNDLKKLEAPVIQKLINELDMYRFSPHYPGDGRPAEADGGSGGFGGV
jgi:hypothetical protein